MRTVDYSFHLDEGVFTTSPVYLQMFTANIVLNLFFDQSEATLNFETAQLKDAVEFIAGS